MSVLMLDYDGAMPRDLPARLTMAVKVHRLTVLTVCYHRTQRGWHVIVHVRQRIAMMRVIALQAALGSDWKREMFNSRRAVAWRYIPRYWRNRVNVLYERHYREDNGRCQTNHSGFRMGKCGTSLLPTM